MYLCLYLCLNLCLYLYLYSNFELYFVVCIMGRGGRAATISILDLSPLWPALHFTRNMMTMMMMTVMMIMMMVMMIKIEDDGDGDGVVFSKNER